jgi:uncharacterized membrane protein
VAWLFPYVLFLHVFGAILAFGPTYAYSIIGSLGRAEPQHANFGLRASAMIGTKLSYPLAILQGVTGVILMLLIGIDGMPPAWLTLGIILYVIALVFALTVQRGRLHKMIELTSAPPPPDAPPGPSPELAAVAKGLAQGGMALGLTVAVIVFLMVVKPSFGL